MPERFQMIEYDFDTHMEIPDVVELPDAGPVNQRAAGPANADYPSETESIPKNEIVQMMNGKSEKIAQEIQMEIRRALPSRIRVEVDIQFYEGSIIAAGTVILLFLQPILIEAGKKVLEKTFETGFTRIIQFAIRRVLSRHMRPYALSRPIEVDITSSMEEEAPPEPQMPAPRANPPANIFDETRIIVPLTAINTILLVLTMVFLAIRGGF